MKWKDARIYKPDCNSFQNYFVTFLCEESIFLGLAGWMPKDNYTDGDWQEVRCTNNNPLGGIVLYWMEHPQIPELI